MLQNGSLVACCYVIMTRLADVCWRRSAVCSLQPIAGLFANARLIRFEPLPEPKPLRVHNPFLGFAYLISPICSSVFSTFHLFPPPLHINKLFLSPPILLEMTTAISQSQHAFKFWYKQLYTSYGVLPLQRHVSVLQLTILVLLLVDNAGAQLLTPASSSTPVSDSIYLHANILTPCILNQRILTFT